MMNSVHLAGHPPTTGSFGHGCLICCHPSSYIFLCRQNLGVTLDCELNFSTHINLLSRDCFYQMLQLRTVTRSLTASATATLVHAFVANRLDYSSSVYAGLPACRLACLDPVFPSSSPLLF